MRHIAAGDSNSLSICSMSVRCGLFLHGETLWWMQAEISCLIDIEWTSGDDCLQTSLQSYTNHTLTFKSWLKFTWLFPTKWRSKRRFCFVQVDQTQHPCHQWGSLPPCGQYLAKSNISPNNEGNTSYNVQSSEKQSCATRSRKVWQMIKVIPKPMSSGEWMQERLGRKTGPSIGSIAQLTF